MKEPIIHEFPIMDSTRPIVGEGPYHGSMLEVMLENDKLKCRYGAKKNWDYLHIHSMNSGTGYVYLQGLYNGSFADIRMHKTTLFSLLKQVGAKRQEEFWKLHFLDNINEDKLNGKKTKIKRSLAGARIPS